MLPWKGQQNVEKVPVHNILQQTDCGFGAILSNTWVDVHKIGLNLLIPCKKLYTVRRKDTEVWYRYRTSESENVRDLNNFPEPKAETILPGVVRLLVSDGHR